MVRPPRAGRWFRGRRTGEVTELDWWQSVRVGRWTLTGLAGPALVEPHPVRPQRHPLVLLAARLRERRYYFAGDSGTFHGFREIGRRSAPLDVALLPIGAYEPRWFMRFQHMDPPEAWRAFLDLGARFLLPMHWGTFDLTDEPVDLAPRPGRGGGSGRRRSHPRPGARGGERWTVPA